MAEPRKRTPGYVLDVATEPWRLDDDDDGPSITTAGGNHVTVVDNVEVGLRIIAVHNAALHLEDACRQTRR